MRTSRGPRSAAIALLTVVGLVAVMAATKPASPAAADDRSTPPPASSASEVPIAALVDDHGAAVLLSRKGGGMTLVGVHRDGRVSWSVPLAKNAIPLGCTVCPDLLISSKRSGLEEVVAGRPHAVGLSHELNNAIGLPGLGPVQQFTALATDAPGGLRLDLLSAPTAADGLELGPELPLTPFQQAHAVIAMSVDGRSAAAVATVGILDPGRWRVLVVRGHSVVLDRVVTPYVPQPEGAPNVAACLTGDGRGVALVTPTRLGADVEVRRGGTVARYRIESVVSIQGCDLGGRLTVATFDPQNQLHLSAFLAGRTRPAAVTTIGDNVNSVQFCPGTGHAVLQNDSGTVLAAPGEKTRTIQSTALSGCTVTGTAWFLGKRKVSWLKGQ